jgi:hypothetical protein
VEARIAWRLARLRPAEEGLEGPIQSRQHVLQHLGVDIMVFGAHVLDGRQLGTLAGSGDAHPALLPGVTAFLETSIVEFAAPTQYKRQRTFLRSSGLEFVLVRLAHRDRLLVHASLFCLIGTKSARGAGYSSPGSSPVFYPHFATLGVKRSG